MDIIVDEEGKPVGQRSRANKPSAKYNDESGHNKTKTLQEEAVLFRQLQAESAALDRQARECPVPKPGGWIGRMMGIESINIEKATKNGTVGQPKS